MKIYNVLFETNYENEDVQSWISSFRNREDAVKYLEKVYNDEIVEEYTDDEIKKRLIWDGDDAFCFYHEDSQSNWKFRCTTYETELN